MYIQGETLINLSYLINTEQQLYEKKTFQQVYKCILEMWTYILNDNQSEV